MPASLLAPRPGVLAAASACDDEVHGAVLDVVSSRADDQHGVFQRALDSISQGVVISDAQRRTTYVNAAFIAMTGYSAEEVLGGSSAILQGPDTSPEVMREMRDALNRGESFHGVLLNYRRDGTPFWNELSITPVRDADGRAVQFVGVQRDVTASRQAADKLALAAKVFEHGNEALAITDSRGLFVAVNRAFTRITGYAEHEVVGQSPRLLKSGIHDQSFYRVFWQEIETHGRWEGEIWNRRKNGTVYPEWLSVGRVTDPEGQTTHYIASFSDITERKHAEECVRRLAYYDPLTALPNRTLLHERAHQAMQIAARSGEPLSLMFLDLDHFKNVNDTLGHPVGDDLLVALTRRIEPALRSQDTLARVGGDEFVVVLPGTDATGASHVAQKLLELARRPFQIRHHELTVTPSIGIALFPDDATDFDTLFSFADAAMYRAKMSGRATFRFYTAELQEQMARALQVENSLRRAIERDELTLHYQPQFAVADGQLLAAEALLRWHHPELGWVSPAELVPIAESSGQITTIGNWVLRTALKQLRDWIDAGLPPIRIAVNLSAVQLRLGDLPTLVSSLLDEFRLDPSLVELELTETIAWSDLDATIATLHRLRELGVPVAIDDFGIGYTSFTHLRQFEPGTLKIDRSLVQLIGEGPEHQAVVAAIVSLAHTLGMRTVAEGVETPDQQAVLAELGCDAAQGWLLSRPMPAADFEALMRRRLGPV